ncbi:MAG: hypothetical protein KDF55_16785 [Thauera sp.]|nr:hypothetical protein [Thauera sp.]
MYSPLNVDPSKPHAKRGSASKAFVSRSTVMHAAVLWLAALIALVPTPARAVDGCLVLLCLAAPSWRAIPQCVPPVQQLFRDLARGKPFPTCSMSGAGNTANHAWSYAPAFCPPQYTRVIDGESAPIYQCDYTGAISVSINGAPFSRTWWSFGGDSVTEFSPAAKTQLGTWDTRFDDDYAKWLASLPPPAPETP